MKAEEATHSIEYTRTIVPSSMRSPYWKYFGFPSDNSNNILTKQKIICTLCNTAIAYNKNTSNLRTHLIAKHCEVLHALQQQLQQQQSQTINVRTAQKRTQDDMTDDQIHSTEESSREKKLKDDSYALTPSDGSDAFMTADYKQQTHALIVEDEVDDVIEMIDPGHAVESGLSDVEDVDYADFETDHQPDEPNEQEQEQQQKNDIDLEDVVQNQDESYAFMNMDNAPQKRVTVAIGTSLEVELEELVVKMLITDLMPITTLDGVGFKHLIGYLGTLDEATVEFKLSTLHHSMHEKITSHLKNICQTQPYSLGIEMTRNVDQMPVISVYLNYYCVEENELVDVLYENILMKEELRTGEKSEDFVEIFNGCNLANCAAYILNEPNDVVETFFREHNIPMVPCLESVLMRCMQSIFDLPSIKNEFKSVLKIAEKLSVTLPEVYPKCPWSKLTFLQFVQDNLSFNTIERPEELNKARDLADFISPLKISLETIGEEPLPLCSLMRPFTLRLLEENFSTFFPDGDYLGEVKNILTDELTKSVLKNSFLNESTFFDGRFRRDFLDASDLVAIKASVCERFKSPPDACSDSRLTIKKEEYGTATSVSSKSNNTRRKSSLKSFFKRNTETNENLSTSKNKPNMEYELNKYNCEPALDLEQCPASWWQENAFTYKQLKKAADFYLSVPCCVNRLFRLDISERNDFLSKRFMLRTQSAQEMWYLHYNRKFYNKLQSLYD